MTPPPPVLSRLKELGEEWGILFLRVAERRLAETKERRPYVHLELADSSGSLVARIWSDHQAFQTSETLEPGQVVKVQGRRKEWRGKDQLEVARLRPAGPGDEEDWEPDTVFGPGWAEVRDLAARRLVLDIETVPLTTDVRQLPQTLVKEVTRVASEREWEIEKVLGLNPLFSKVACIAVGDAEGEGGHVLIAPDPEDLEDLRSRAPSWLLPMPEDRMLGAFWTLAARAERVITFNGRNFDLPFLRTRSAILGQAVFVDLLGGSPWNPGRHLDLYRVLGGGGRPQAPSSLDAACWAFGIESPKGTMDGSMVAPAWREKRYLEIAEYNRSDIEATRSLYHKLKTTVLDFLP